MTPLDRCQREQAECGEYLRGDGPDKAGARMGAAKQLGRRAIGIEIEERYCAIAVQRLSQEMLPFIADPEPQAEQLTLDAEPDAS